jgi:hypothetical protein
MEFWQRVLQGALLILGGWLALILAGFLAGILVGSITAIAAYLLIGVFARVFVSGAMNAGGLWIAASIVLGLVAFAKTFMWFATLGGLLTRR